MTSAPTTGNPWVDLFLFAALILVGGSSGGAVVAIRKDRREEKAAALQRKRDEAAGERDERTTEVALTETLNRIAEAALERQEDRHAEERETWAHEKRDLLERLDRQDARIRQLEQAMIDAKIAVPAPLRIVREG